MTDKMKVEITNAVYSTYDHTNGFHDRCEYSERVDFECPSAIGEGYKHIIVTRVKGSDADYYKLYINSIDEPFMTVFGFWPIGFVSDIFIKTLEHYYDWY